MKVAVPYENGQVFQHYGKTERFKIYDIEDDKIVTETTVDTNGSGHGALVGILENLHADILICGGIGDGAKAALSQANIKLWGGVTGDADEAVKAYLSGALDYNPEVTCNHHHDHQEGDCGEHTCGE